MGSGLQIQSNIPIEIIVVFCFTICLWCYHAFSTSIAIQTEITKLKLIGFLVAQKRPEMRLVFNLSGAYVTLVLAEVKRTSPFHLQKLF